MKNLSNMRKIVTITILLAIVFAACENGIVPEPELGSISGTARFTVGENHAGITVTLEKTDGPRSLGAVSAARNVAAGHSIDAGRAIIGGEKTGADGSFSFNSLEAGWYTVYASSQDSKERAVAINIPLVANQSVTNVQLNLTTVGSISGRIMLDGSQNNNSGFLVCVAGTSYMAMTDAAGNFTISDIPAAEDKYLIIVMKGNVTFPWSEEAVSVEGGKPTELGTKELTGEEIIDSFITISTDGFWVINGVKTTIKAQGEDGKDGIDGTNGTTPHIGEDGYWYIGIVNTGIKAQGEDGVDGIDGTNGTTPHIGDDGYWYIGIVNTGIKAQGVDGNDGTTPHIGEDGYWHIGVINTGVKAQGIDGETCDCSESTVPAAYAALLGEWYMVGTQQTPPVNYNETVFISHNEIRIIDTSSPRINGQLEHIYFTITKWEEAYNHNPNPTVRENYPNGFKLSGVITSFVGYSVYPNLSTMYLFLSHDGLRFVRANEFNGSTTFIPRVYSREDNNSTIDPPPTNVDLTRINITSGSTIIGFAGLDGDYPLDLLLDSKFLVLAFAGSNLLGGNGDVNTDGFGGMQIVLQGPGDGYAWNQTNTPGWTSFSNDGEETIYVVIELAKLVGYPAAFDPDGDDPKGKIIFNHGIIETTYLGAYLTTFDLVAGAYDVAYGEVGFITRDIGLVFE